MQRTFRAIYARKGYHAGELRNRLYIRSGEIEYFSFFSP